MAEMSPTSSSSQKILAAINALKGRSGDVSDDQGMNFVDVMMARVTAHQNTKDELKDIVTDADKRSHVQGDYGYDRPDPWIEQARHAQTSRKEANKVPTHIESEPHVDHAANRQEATTQAHEKSETKTSTEAHKQHQDHTVSSVESVKDTQNRDKTKSDIAFDGLKDVAQLLLDADQDGTLSLPHNVKAILEKIAATEATDAGQVLPLMQNLLTVLRKLEDGPAGKDLNKILGDATWGEDIVKLFSDLQIHLGIKADQKINIGKMIKALRALSHIAQSDHTGDAQHAVPNTGAMPLVMQQEYSDKATSVENGGVMFDQEKNKKNKELASDLAGVGLDVPNSQQKPDLSHNPLNPMVKPERGVERNLDAGRDISDAFARGAQQGRIGGDGSAAGRAATSQMIQSAATGGKEAAFDAPRVDVATSAQALNVTQATTQAARAAAVAQANQLPHPATQQLLVHVQKFPITKDTQLSISLNPAELGRVDVKITIDQHGKATAVIMADKPETLALLQRDGQHLEKALQQAGLNSSAQDLHYSLKEQAQQREHESGKNRRRALFDGDEDARTLSVDTHIRDDGLPYRINYHA